MLKRKALCRNWQKERSKDSWEKYKESSQCAKKTVSLAQENNQR